MVEKIDLSKLTNLQHEQLNELLEKIQKETKNEVRIKGIHHNTETLAVYIKDIKGHKFLGYCDKNLNGFVKVDGTRISG